MSRYPRHYRDALHAYHLKASSGESFAAKSLLLSLGYTGVEQLERAAQKEEAEAQPESLSQAEAELARAQALAAQAEQRLAAEHRKFAEIEAARVQLHQARKALERVPSMKAITGDIASLEAALVNELAHEFEGGIGSDVYRTARINDLIHRLAKQDAISRVHSALKSLFVSRVNSAEKTLADFEAAEKSEATLEALRH